MQVNSVANEHELARNAILAGLTVGQPVSTTAVFSRAQVGNRWLTFGLLQDALLDLLGAQEICVDGELRIVLCSGNGTR